MKKLFLILAMVFCASCVSAYTISWDAVDGADGYVLYYAPVDNWTLTELDTLQNTEVDLDALNLQKGTRYEFYVRLYVGDPKSYSGESDHLRWTYPEDPKIIELPEDQKVIINIYQVKHEKTIYTFIGCVVRIYCTHIDRFGKDH